MLLDDDIESFQNLGFLKVPKVIVGEHLARWHESFDRAVLEQASLTPARPGLLAKRFGNMEDGRQMVFDQRLHLAHSNLQMREMLTASVVCELARTLIGEEPLIWWDQAIIKHPWALATPPHVDSPAFATNDRRVLSAWIALDDAQTTTGCLFYLPQTQNLGSLAQVTMSWKLDALFSDHPEWASIEPVFVPASPGDVIFHSGFVAHGAAPNLSPKTRRAHSIVFVPQSATLARRSFAGALAWRDGAFDHLSDGDELGSSELFLRPI